MLKLPRKQPSRTLSARETKQWNEIFRFVEQLEHLEVWKHWNEQLCFAVWPKECPTPYCVIFFPYAGEKVDCAMRIYSSPSDLLSFFHLVTSGVRGFWLDEVPGFVIDRTDKSLMPFVLQSLYQAIGRKPAQRDFRFISQQKGWLPWLPTSKETAILHKILYQTLGVVLKYENRLEEIDRLIRDGKVLTMKETEAKKWEESSIELKSEEFHFDRKAFLEECRPLLAFPFVDVRIQFGFSRLAVGVFPDDLSDGQSEKVVPLSEFRTRSPAFYEFGYWATDEKVAHWITPFTNPGKSLEGVLPRLTVKALLEICRQRKGFPKEIETESPLLHEWLAQLLPSISFKLIRREKLEHLNVDEEVPRFCKLLNDLDQPKKRSTP